MERKKTAAGARPAVAKRTASAAGTAGRGTSRSPRRKATEPTQELIAERAYHIHISGQGGDALADWLRAEAELRVAG